MANKRFYSVTIGLYGYLPNDCALFDNLGDARQYAQGEKEAFLDYSAQGDDDIRVYGNIRREREYDVCRRSYTGDGWVSWQRIAIQDVSDEVSESEYIEYMEHGLLI